MKIIGLDLGDQWTGIAISDTMAMFARTYETVQTSNLNKALTTIFEKESIKIAVVGHPKTMTGTKSAQTLKVEAEKEQLAQQFPAVTWVLWDERLSSKRAEALTMARTKEEKIHTHAVAAAFILQSYLDFLGVQASNPKNL